MKTIAESCRDLIDMLEDLSEVLKDDQEEAFFQSLHVLSIADRLEAEMDAETTE